MTRRRGAGLEPMPVTLGLRRDPGGRGRRGRSRLRPLRELDRGRGAGHARHARLRRRGRRPGRRARLSDQPLPDRPRAEVPLDQIEVVLSHPQGTAQCARFIREQLPAAEVRAASSTAEAVRLVSEQTGAVGGARAPLRPPSAMAARCSARASRTSPTTSPASSGSLPRGTEPEGDGPWRTSLIFSELGDDKPGALVDALQAFSDQGVNLTRIESRPRPGGLGATCSSSTSRAGSRDDAGAQGDRGAPGSRRVRAHPRAATRSVREGAWLESRRDGQQPPRGTERCRQARRRSANGQAPARGERGWAR